MNEVGSSAVSTNQYTFNCPTVKRDARYIVCVFKRSKHMRGENFPDQDCRCAMRGSKCPVVRMVAREYRADERMWYSNSNDVKKLPAELVQELDRVILMPFHAAGLNLTDQNKIDLFGEVVATPARMVLDTEPTDSSTPKVTIKRKAALASSRSVEDDMVDGFGDARVDTASAINSTLGI